MDVFGICIIVKMVLMSLKLIQTRLQLNKNKSRDEKNKKLISESWNVIDIWECKLVREYEKTLIDYLIQRFVMSSFE